jgi:hypothetical protein
MSRNGSLLQREGMNQRVHDDETRPVGMHARHRFGDVVPSIEADDELAWVFNHAALDCAAPSVLGAMRSGRHPGSLAVTEACIEALHSALDSGSPESSAD